jgi:Cu/Ag efflux pump CusA
VLRARILVILLALGVLAASIWPAGRLGSEFMPNLNEGTAALHADDASRHLRDQGGPS